MHIEVECCVCGTKIMRSRGELNRNAKLGRRIYCSRSCCGKDNIGNVPQHLRGGNLKNLRADNRADEYSMFRVFMHKINMRVKERKYKMCNLTLHDLKEQWEKQDGVCPYTGWRLTAPKNSKEKRLLTPGTASLDRIDSTKGYIKGNIEFVCFMAQCAKHTFKKEDVFEFCSSVSNKSY